MSNIRRITVAVVVAAALNGCATSAAPDSPAKTGANTNADANAYASASTNANTSANAQIPSFAGSRANPSSLDGILANLRGWSTPAQYQVFADAIHASPKLAAQLQALVDAGLLTQLRVGQPGEETWGAWRKGGDWVFMPDFIASQSPHPIMHVAHEGDMLPNNMALTLGFMTWHAQHDDTLARKVKLLYASGLRTHLNQVVELQLQTDACALIQGWNDVADVAMHQNHGAPPTQKQIVALTTNLLYGAPLLKAIATPGFHFDQNSGSIPMDKQNIDAMTKAVGQSRMFNIKPPFIL